SSSSSTLQVRDRPQAGASGARAGTRRRKEPTHGRARVVRGYCSEYRLATARSLRSSSAVRRGPYPGVSRLMRLLFFSVPATTVSKPILSSSSVAVALAPALVTAYTRSRLFFDP